MCFNYSGVFLAPCSSQHCMGAADRSSGLVHPQGITGKPGAKRVLVARGASGCWGQTWCCAWAHPAAELEVAWRIVPLLGGLGSCSGAGLKPWGWVSVCGQGGCPRCTRLVWGRQPMLRQRWRGSRRPSPPVNPLRCLTLKQSCQPPRELGPASEPLGNITTCWRRCFPPPPAGHGVSSGM